MTGSSRSNGCERRGGESAHDAPQSRVRQPGSIASATQHRPVLPMCSPLMGHSERVSPTEAREPCGSRHRALGATSLVHRGWDGRVRSRTAARRSGLERDRRWCRGRHSCGSHRPPPTQRLTQICRCATRPPPGSGRVGLCRRWSSTRVTVLRRHGIFFARTFSRGCPRTRGHNAVRTATEVPFENAGDLPE